MDIKQVRLNNLHIVVSECGGIVEFCNRCNVDKSYIGLIMRGYISPKGRLHTLGYNLAKRIETGLEKPFGWLDADRSNDMSSVKTEIESNIEINAVKKILNIFESLERKETISTIKFLFTLYKVNI